MERDPFSQQVQRELAEVRSREAASSQRAREQASNEAQRNADLERARARLKQHCRDAAAHLRSLGVPTEVAQTQVGLNPGTLPGHRTPATKFKTAIFPRGWVIARDTKGQAAEVLTEDGKWFMVWHTKTAFAEVGVPRECPYERYSTMAVDEHGPYLLNNLSGSYDPTIPRTGPPPGKESEITQKVAEVIYRSGKA